ncbi:Wzz/FepE/Etk N-terminal domain-containing protein [Aeromicrobium sp. Root472D3]|uniref:Wzz/FepE/Etk N-terminal domain-containing protein n=1 Tax=Aeromicrobium sp. Root472D3 TaxID=1736540 RepID=UPI000AD4DE7E|nr:Wzz/FepE/Etk N-terminal domain-containing protein [Aeromicrobium sp. Root472D3]
METLTLTELAARLARRWRMLLTGTLVGLLVGVAVHLALPTRYQATAVVLVDAGDPSRVDMAAEAAVASSRRVSTEALDALGEPGLTVRALERSTDATTVEQSRLLRVSCAAADPRSAVRGADAVAQAYLAVRALEQPDAPGSPGRVDGQVVDPARTPLSPSGPGAVPTALAATVLGLLLAATVAAAPTRTRGGRAS